MRGFFTLLLVFCVALIDLSAQTDLEVDPNDLMAGGDTRSLGNNCYRLTTAQNWESGTVWYDPVVDLKEPFEMEMNIMFGCKDVLGADGIVFIFHSQKVPTGYKGEGMGFGGLRPSVGIEIDTWENEHLLDPPDDHVALMQNGSVSHYHNLKGPIKIPNVEDCNPHKFRINWEPDQKLISVMLDGTTILTHNIDLIRDIFHGNSQIYWGVSSATGKYNNLQEICFEQLTFNTPQLGYSTKRKLLEGDILDLKNFKFGINGININPTMKKELNKLVLFLQENPKMSIAVYTHSNEGKGKSTDDQLSNKRADLIKEYLIRQGINAKRISTHPLGQQQAVKKIGGKEVIRDGNWVSVYMHVPRA